MNPKIDVKALEEMLKFLLKDIGSKDESIEEETGEEEPMEEIDKIADSIDDDYIKPENKEVRIPKHKRPKKMAFSLSELSIKAPKDFKPIEEEKQKTKRKRA